MGKNLIPGLLVFLLAGSTFLETKADELVWENVEGRAAWPKVLAVNDAVGWRHDSLGEAAMMMESHAAARNWDLTMTSNTSYYFSSLHILQEYDVIVFLTNTGPIFNTTHQENFKSYVEQGGSVAGTHSGGVDTNRNWPYHEDIFGATLSGHPHVQYGTVITENLTHATTSFLPERWEIRDEFYDYNQPFTVGDKKILLSIDENSYEGGAHNEFHPISWTRLQGPSKSRVWFTAFGHTKEIYIGNEDHDIRFQEHVALGVEWAANGTATSRKLAFDLWQAQLNETEQEIGTDSEFLYSE